MKKSRLFWLVLLFAFLVGCQNESKDGQTDGASGSKSTISSSSSSSCIDCHKKNNSQIISDWETSKHSKNNVGCAVCHGSDHNSVSDAIKAKSPTPDTCGACHKNRVEQFKKGKHAFAWVAMNAMPTTHWKPMAMIEGMKGCGGCHKIGLKDAKTIHDLNNKGQRFGISSCDSCHTRHAFSIEEARQPQACQTCHMGFDHPQWEMYSSSKHGVRYLLRQNGVLPKTVAAPSCQTCHMQDGNHEVRTAWGFLAVRLPMPTDPQWAKDRTTILKGLGVLDPKGKPTKRLEVVKAADVARLTQEDWQKERDKMIKTCSQCHSANFAKSELEKGDNIIKEADRLMARAIEIVANLYKKGKLKKPANYSYPYPDLLTFHDAPSSIELKLHTMFLEHRMRTFQGAFHGNPDYSLWYGWNEMLNDLNEIEEKAKNLSK